MGMGCLWLFLKGQAQENALRRDMVPGGDFSKTFDSFESAAEQGAIQDPAMPALPGWGRSA
jgi:hypothetical protein